MHNLLFVCLVWFDLQGLFNRQTGLAKYVCSSQDWHYQVKIEICNFTFFISVNYHIFRSFLNT